MYSKIEKEEEDHAIDRYIEAERIGKIGSFEASVDQEELWWSHGLYALLGFKPFSFTPTKSFFLRLINPKDKDRYITKIESSLKKAREFQEEFSCQHEDGEWVNLEIRASAIFDEGGRFVGYKGTMQDITERKKMESELFINAKKFASWKSSKVIGIVQSTSTGKIIDANDTFLEMIGYDRKELCEDKIDWRKITPDEYLYLDTKAIKQSQQQGYFDPFEKEYIHKKGHRVPISIGGSLVNDDEYVAFIFDLSHKVRAKEELDQAEKKLKELAQVMDKTSIIAHTDAKGIITYVNDNFCQISGYSEKELLGKTHKIVNSGFHSDRFFKGMWQSITAKKEWRGQIKNRAKDGSFYWTDTLIHPRLSAAGNIESIIAVRNVITKEKEQQEADIKTLRLASIGEASAQIMHDVMNPLTIIAGTAHSLLSLSLDEKSAKKAEKASKLILSNVTRIQNIFQDIRAMLHEKVDLERIDLTRIVKEAISQCTHKITKEKIDLQTKVSEPIHVLGNKNLLTQVFINLIKNAIEAIAAQEEKWLHIEATVTESAAFIKVIDSGSGIPIENQQHIFDSFYTTKKDAGGTGIGLGICQKIMKVHNGTIKINTDNKNTEFQVSLPVSLAQDSKKAS